MEYMEEEHLRYSKWIECRLVRSVIQKKQGKEFKCLCHDDNERERFNASPEYRKIIKNLTRMEIEQIGTSTFTIE